MGNHGQSSIFTTEVQWEIIQSKRHEIAGSPALSQHKITYLQADMYQIHGQTHFIDKINTINKLTQANNKSFLRYLYIYLHQNQSLICGGRPLVHIFTQKIIARYTQVTFQDMHELYIMSEVVKSFDSLSLAAGCYFKVQGQMIAFNQKSEIKVWLNQHYGKLVLEQTSLAINQEQMVTSIHNIFKNIIHRYQLTRATTFGSLRNKLQLLLNGLNIHKIRLAIEDILKLNELPRIIKTQMNSNSKTSMSQLNSPRKNSKRADQKKLRILQGIKISLSPRGNKQNYSKEQHLKANFQTQKQCIISTFNPHNPNTHHISFPNQIIQTHHHRVPQPFLRSPRHYRYPSALNQLQRHFSPFSPRQIIGPNITFLQQKNNNRNVNPHNLLNNPTIPPMKIHHIPPSPSSKTSPEPEQPIQPSNLPQDNNKMIRKASFLRNPSKKFSSIIQQQVQEQELSRHRKSTQSNSQYISQLSNKSLSSKMSAKTFLESN